MRQQAAEVNAEDFLGEIYGELETHEAKYDLKPTKKKHILQKKNILRATLQYYHSSSFQQCICHPVCLQLTDVINRVQLDSLRKHLREIDTGSATSDKLTSVDFTKWRSSIANKAFLDQVQVIKTLQLKDADS